MNRRIIVNRRKRQKRRQMMMRNILRVVVPLVLLSVALCLLVGRFFLPDEDEGADFSDEAVQEELMAEAEAQGEIPGEDTAEVPAEDEVIPEQAVRIPVRNDRDTAKTTVLNPGWHEDRYGRWYQNPDRTYFSNGFEEIDGVQYYFDEEGYIRTGWVTIGKKDYYFNQDGSYNRDRKRSLLALTFNGGPSAYTDSILDILEENEAHATFFVKGQNVEGCENTLQRMTELGCEIGSNSWDDLQLNLITMEEVISKFEDTDEALEKACGRKAEIARAPYAMANETIYETVGKPFFTWSLDVEDGDKMDASSEYDAVMEAELSDGTIILMHDIYAPTVQAVEQIIPELVEKGYKLVTLSEMAEAKEVELQNTVYSNFLQSTLDTGTVPGYAYNGEIMAKKTGAEG